MSTFSSDDVFEDSFSEEDGVYDDPYEVVMYDIDENVASDVHALLNMLTDDDRSWYAKRRLSVLASTGPLSALIAAVITDSLGRRWDPLLHPRDRFGQFIETGGFFRWFMKGAWSKGQVVRIDSDGTIHARSKGNDGIPDGTPIKFNSKQANRLISTASDKASLSNDMPDFDAPIPDFPEASASQRRVYNMLQFGDMPGEDLYIYRDSDMDTTAFGNEMSDLVKRNLISIDKGDKPRARRNDQDELGVIDISDDDIGDVPDDETPDLDDSPGLTKAQRDLYDQMIEMDRGEGDGLGRDELTGVDEADLDALVEAGVLERDGDRFDLVNPEGADVIDDVDAPETDAPEAETEESNVDIVDALEKAAKARFPRNPEQEEAFALRAGELAGLAEDDPAAEYDRDEKRARAAAEAWWEEFNAPTPGGDTPEGETDTGVSETNPDAPKFDRPQALRQGRTLLAQFMTDEELDNPLGEEYARGVGYLIHAQDLEDAGDERRAKTFRDMADTSMRKAEVPDEVREQDWEAGVRAFRADRDAEVSEVEEVDAPEAEVDVPEDMPEADVPEDLPDEDANARREAIDQFFAEESAQNADAPETDDSDAEFGTEIGTDTAEALDNVGDLGKWMDWVSAVSARRDPNGDLNDELISEKKIADEMGLDLFDEKGVVNWSSFMRNNDVDMDVAEELYKKHNGNAGMAALDHLFGRESDEDGIVMNEEISDPVSANEVDEDFVGEPEDVPDPISVNEVDEDFLAEGLDAEQALEDAASDAPSADAPDADAIDPEDKEAAVVTFTPAPSDLVPSEEHPDFKKLRALDDPDFMDDKPELNVTDEVLDRAGRPIEIGAWYKANAGGQGDADQVVAFFDQKKYPNWVLTQAPDGKLKAVNSQGDGPRAGLNRLADPSTEELNAMRVQRAVADEEILNLDQDDPKNMLFSGNNKVPGAMAVPGMRVKYRGGGGFGKGEEGVIVRIGWDPGENRPLVYVIKPGARGQEEEFAIGPRMLEPVYEVTEAPEIPTPSPDAPDVVPEGDAPEADVPEVILPDGADNEFEGALLDQLDGAGSAGLPRNVMIDIDDDDMDEKFDGLRALLERGVIESFNDPDDGQKRYRRVAQGPVMPEGAQNEMEANLLEAIDGFEGPVRRSALMGMDDEDFDDRLAALRGLVDRGVLRQGTDDEGKPVFRRPGGSGSSPQSMTDAEAEEALRGGADPMLIANDSLDRALDRAGFTRVLNGDAGISSQNFWVMGPQQGDFPVTVKGHGVEDRKVYMVKRSANRSFMPNDVLNEVMAGAVSADILERHGRDDENGPLFHPRVGIAEAPKGTGPRAGGAIIMDHAAYGYSKDHKVVMGHTISDSKLQAGGASKDILRLAMYDFLINNTQDRHQKNQMFVQDPATGEFKVVIIDNGFAYGAAEGQGGVADLRFQDYLRKSRPSGLVNRADRSNVDEVRSTVQGFVDAYSGFDVESVMTRVRSTYPSITPEQEEYVQKWLRVTEARVRYLAENTETVVQLLLNV